MIEIMARLNRLALCLALLGASFTVHASELRIWARMTFEEKGLAFSEDGNLLSFPVAPQNPNAKAHLALRYYPKTVNSYLQPLEVVAPGADGTGHAVAPVKPDGIALRGGDLVLLFERLGMMPAAPDMMFAFKLFVSEDDVASYRIVFNSAKDYRRKVDVLMRPKCGGWNFMRVPLHLPKAIDIGDAVQNVRMVSSSSKSYGWMVDDIVAWSGDDAQPPDTVATVTVTADGDDNLVSWTPSADNLAIAYYEIHRGTVRDFTPSHETLIAESVGCSFKDICPMHEASFYKVIAIDYADNHSIPSTAARRK